MFILSNNLNKYYFQLNTNSNNILKILDNILIINNILKKRLNMKTLNINYNSVTNTYIPRSSYKFCNFKDACNYNYDLNKNKGCYAHHYVYNLLEYDLTILIYYINNFISENINSNKQVTKSLTTINFVIKHMYEELQNIFLYSDNKIDIEKFHINNFKNIKNKNKKRNINFG